MPRVRSGPRSLVPCVLFPPCSIQIPLIAARGLGMERHGNDVHRVQRKHKANVFLLYSDVALAGRKRQIVMLTNRLAAGAELGAW